jgi:hydrogenase maturation factor
MVKVTVNTVCVTDMIKQLDTDQIVDVSYVKKLIAFAADMQLLNGTKCPVDASVGDLVIMHHGLAVGYVSNKAGVAVLNGRVIANRYGERPLRFALRFMRALDPTLHAVMKSVIKTMQAEELTHPNEGKAPDMI